MHFYIGYTLSIIKIDIIIFIKLYFLFSFTCINIYYTSYKIQKITKYTSYIKNIIYNI